MRGLMIRSVLRDGSRRLSTRLLGATAGALFGLLLAAQAVYAACEATDTGPSECLPVEMVQSGARELTFAVGVCVAYYAWDTPQERANPLAILTGPGGFSQEFHSTSFNNQYLVAFPPTAVQVPSAGTYTLTVTTFSYTVEPALFCYSGKTAASVTVRDQSQSTPRPSARPPVVTPRPPTPAPTSRPTPFWPTPDIGTLPPGSQAEATRRLPIRREPAGAASGQFLEDGERALITGAPVLQGGQYWYPIEADIAGWVGAGTGADAWLIAATATEARSPSPSPSHAPRASPTPSPSLVPLDTAASAGPPMAVLGAAGAGALVILVTVWLLFGRASPPVEGETPQAGASDPP